MTSTTAVPVQEGVWRVSIDFDDASDIIVTFDNPDASMARAEAVAYVKMCIEQGYVEEKGRDANVRIYPLTQIVQFHVYFEVAVGVKPGSGRR